MLDNTCICDVIKDGSICLCVSMGWSRHVVRMCVII